ncbi:hypothetical protein PSFL111601_17180 [Pseudomonas floridensis]
MRITAGCACVLTGKEDGYVQLIAYRAGRTFRESAGMSADQAPRLNTGFAPPKDLCSSQQLVREEARAGAGNAAF